MFPAPFGVRLNADDYTYLEPDITVICDRDKLDDAGAVGAPDFVIEILSPSNREHDTRRKFALYEKAGVREYWLIYPEEKAVQTFTLTDGSLIPDRLALAGGELPVTVLEGCTVDLNRVFTE